MYRFLFFGWGICFALVYHFKFAQINKVLREYLSEYIRNCQNTHLSGATIDSGIQKDMKNDMNLLRCNCNDHDEVRTVNRKMDFEPLLNHLSEACSTEAITDSNLVCFVIGTVDEEHGSEEASEESAPKPFSMISSCTFSQIQWLLLSTVRQRETL